MKFKHTQLLALLLLFSNFLFSQFKLEEGPEMELPSDEYRYRGIYGSTDANFYVCRLSEKKIEPKVRIEKYDSKSLSQIIAKEITLLQEKGEVYSTDARRCHIEVRFLNKISFIFYSFFNDDLKAAKVYYITIDDNGIVSSPKTLASDCINYSLLISPDKLHFGIISNLRVGKAKANDPDYQNFSDVANLDFYAAATMNKIYSKKINDVTGNRKIYINNYCLDNDGTLSYFKTEMDDSYIAKLKKLEFALLPNNSESAIYHNFEFPEAPNYMNSSIYNDLSITKSCNLFTSFGVYTKDFYFLKINNISKTAGNVTFDYQKITALSQKILDLKCKLMPVSTEEFNGNVYSIFKSDSKCMMISKIAKDGGLEWSVPFPIKNEIPEIFNYTPYKLLYLNNKINFYYIDHPRNLSDIKLNSSFRADDATVATRLKGTNIVCLSVTENGIAQREVVHLNDEFSAVPSYDAEAPFIRLYSKKKEKFARIK